MGDKETKAAWKGEGLFAPETATRQLAFEPAEPSKVAIQLRLGQQQLEAEVKRLEESRGVSQATLELRMQV